MRAWHAQALQSCRAAANAHTAAAIKAKYAPLSLVDHWLISDSVIITPCNVYSLQVELSLR